MAPLRLLLTGLRADWPIILLVVLVTTVTAFLAAASPRLLTAAADAGLRHEVDSARPIERNLQLGRITRITQQPWGIDRVAEVATAIRGELPASVRMLIREQEFLAESISWRIHDRPAAAAGFLRLRLQHVADHIRLVDGRLPAARNQTVVSPEPPPGSSGFDGEFRAPLFEVALSAASAKALGATIGDRLDLFPDPQDPLVGHFGLPEGAAVEVVGIYEVRDPRADFWVGDVALDRPNRVPVGTSAMMTYATALASPDAYAALMRTQTPVRYTFRYLIDPQRLDVGVLGQLVIDLRRMEATYASFVTGPDPDTTTLQTGLDQLLARYRAEYRATQAVLLTAAIGPAAVALVAVVQLAALLVDRRRRSSTLLRGRGGSLGQMSASHLAEGILISFGPCLLAAWLATRVVIARDTRLEWPAVAAVALVVTLALLAAALRDASVPLHRAERQAPADLRASPRRLVAEGVVVALATGGVILVRQRGLAGESAAGPLDGVDPFLAAVPALVGIAVGIVALRLYALPLRLAGSLALRTRGVVLSLGLRRATAQTSASQLPMVLLLLTVAIATFSSTLLATLEREQAAASWRAVGAAHRISASTGLPPELDPSTISEVQGVARAHETDASVDSPGNPDVRLLAIDGVEHEAVTRGTPVQTQFPAAFHQPPGERPGTVAEPIPAIASTALATSLRMPMSRGDAVALTIAGRSAAFQIVELRSAFPPYHASDDFVLVPWAHLAGAMGDRVLSPTTMFVAASQEVRPALERLAEDAGPDVVVDSQAVHLDAVRSRPLIQAIAQGFRLALATALLYAALAIVLSLVLAGRARARESAHLRTFGIDRAQVVGLAALEHVPPLVVAMLGGLGLGIAVAWVVLPGLELGAFTGSAADPAFAVDFGQLASLAMALVGIVAAGVALSAVVQRRVDPARAVREGIE